MPLHPQAETFLDHSERHPPPYEIPTTFSLYERMVVGLSCMGGFIDAGRAAIDDVATALRAPFAWAAS
ncbi:MAG: hypothetical protein ACRDY4_08220 [Acidimicrobiia bacterium]